MLWVHYVKSWSGSWWERAISGAQEKRVNQYITGRLGAELPVI